MFHLILGQSDPAPLQHDMETYKARMESFGFHAIVVDGHDMEELIKAFAEAEVFFSKIIELGRLESKLKDDFMNDFK